jgi:phenylpyruvate tautomerase PptA (4-oxalocrotonate tautomerase family)
MPHLTVMTTETQVVGRERALISELTDAVADVYGEWARPLVTVRIVALPADRWGVGGQIAVRPSPTVRFELRAGALTRPGGQDVARHLVARVTDAVASVLDEELHPSVIVELVPQPDHLVGVGGNLISEP